MLYRDLREWLAKVEEAGELKTIPGVDWNLEMGAIAELFPAYAVLFDSIKDYPPGYRVVVGLLSSLKRSSLTSHLPLDTDRNSFISAWRDRLHSLCPLPPVEVEDGPLLENVKSGKEINLWDFPSPKWHELDGGRYIGTADVAITADPDEGWINLGTYRVMVHDRDILTLYISPGKHGRIHREKYFAAKKPCPVAITFGQDPLLFLLASKQMPFGESEYDYAGAIRGAPYEVIRGELTGLPIPAYAEIAVEGEILPDEKVSEGPFGEWTGYYASGEQKESVVRVKRLMHRNHPIITGAPPFRQPAGADTCNSLVRAAAIWNTLEKAGVPEIRGVACYQAFFFTVVAIRQRYPGHARQVGVLASHCDNAGYMGRYVVVVDDDIDVADFNDVLWAMCTRVDPIKSIEFTERCWSGPLDPIIPKAEKGFNSRAIIDACRPFEWMKDFPPVSGASRELKDKVKKKYRFLTD
ncbi:MAG: UbiD family decarboxylase [Candidatus Binatota bacterium]